MYYSTKLNLVIFLSKVHAPYMKLYYCFTLIQQVANVTIRYTKLQNTLLYGPRLLLNNFFATFLG